MDASGQRHASHVQDSADVKHLHASEAKVGHAAVEQESDELLLPNATGHYPFLDITRIVCVLCVAIDHGDSNFGIWDVMFTQSWVLQFLYLVCGVCYGMSSQTLFGYVVRLSVYLCIGIMVNWSAWLVTGKDWRHDFFNVVFHLWFVVGIILYAVLLWPLRPYLQRARAKPRTAAELAARHTETAHEHVEDMEEASARSRSTRESLLRALAVIGGGLVGLLLFFNIILVPVLEAFAPMVLNFWAQFGKETSFWGLPQNLDESKQFIRQMGTYFLLTCSNIYLIIVCPIVFEQRTLTGWMVLLNTYGNRLLFHRGADERAFHGLDIMMVTMTCYYLGLKGRRKIGEYVIRYWFVILFVCSVLYPPGSHIRYDEHPPQPYETSLRMRLNLIEFMFILGWLTAGERLFQPEIFTEDRLEFLNDWSLIVFLVHKAVHIMFLPPFNWVAIGAVAPACYIVRQRQRK